MNGGTVSEGDAALLDRFTTDRLIAARIRESHLGDLLRMDSDPRIMETIGGVRTEEDTRVYLRANLDHWEQHGFGLWMLYRRDDATFVGRAYLRHLHIAGHNELAIGYALLPEHWGQGLATEIAAAVTDIAFGPLGIESVVAGAQPRNAASRRVIEKIGGRFEVETTYKGKPHVLYRIVRSDSQ